MKVSLFSIPGTFQNANVDEGFMDRGAQWGRFMTMLCFLFTMVLSMLLMDPETSAVLTELSSPPINSDLSVPVPGVCVSGGPGFMAMLSSQMKKSAPSSVSNHYNHISNEFVTEC